MIRVAKNGCSTDVTFKKKKVYFDWDTGIPLSSLGAEQNKTDFIKSRVLEIHIQEVENMLIDWNLYENGWYVNYPKGGYKNKHLFYYLSQMGQYGSHRPKELEYFT